MLTFGIKKGVVVPELFQKRIVRISADDVIIKTTHSEMKKIDANVVPVTGIIMFGKKERRINLYYSAERKVYFAYVADIPMLENSICSIIDYKNSLQ